MGVFLWIIFCIIVGVIASGKGRSGVGWFFIAAVTSPLLGGIIVLCLSNLNEERHYIMEQEHLRNRVITNENITDYRLNRIEGDVDRLATNQNNMLSGGNVVLNERNGIKCPKCGNVADMWEYTCKYCKTSLEPLLFPKEEMKNEEIENNEKNMECPYCKEIIKEGAIKCKHCGSNLEDYIKQISEEKGLVECSYCKELIKKGAIKCKHCKSDLAASFFNEVNLSKNKVDLYE